MTDQPPAASAESGSIDVRAIVAVFRRHQYIFLGVAAVIMLAVVAFTLTRTPAYTASASVLVQPQQANILKDQGAAADASSAAVDTEVQVIGSRALAERVASSRELVRDPEFNAALDPKAGAAKAAAAAGQQKVPESIVDAVQGRIKARRSGLTYVIDVSFTASNPDKAARLANAVAEEYIAAQTEAKYSVAHNDNNWISSRLKALEQEVRANEAAVQQYKIANNLMSAQGATMAEQEISALNQQLAASRAELAEKQGRLNAALSQISQGGGGGDVSAALGSEVIRDLRRQRAEITRRQADLLTRYGPRHPDVQKAEQELADTDRQIQEEIGRNISNLRAELQVAQQRASSLAASRGGAQGTLGANSRALVSLNELERKAEASRAIYEAFLNKSKETSAQEGLQRPDARISSPAQPPTGPSSPKKGLNFALGLVLAFGGGVAGVVIAESLDGSLRTSSEVERRLRVASIGAIPLLPKKIKQKELTYVIDSPFTGFAEAFRSLRTSLMLSGQDRPLKVIVITSAIPGEGKTLTTASFARSAAQSGIKVLLVDADLRRRSLTASIGAPVQAGLVELLSGEARLDDTLHVDPVSGATLLLLSDKSPPTSDLFGSEKFEALLKQLRDRFDLVLFDTAPVLAVAETRMVAAKADATVFLVRWSKTPTQAARAAIDMLLDAGAFVAGVCLTQVDVAMQARAGYGDNLYYYNQYRKYYAD